MGNGLHVALVEPEIHWNTGNVGRTCLAAGAHLHLIEPLGFSLDDKAVRRAGLDYWVHVDPTVWSSWADFEHHSTPFGEPWLVSPDGDASLWSVDLRKPTVLVFGRESTGLPTDLRRRFRHRLVSLPICSPHVRSLNLSTCVGIALYEALRQRQTTRTG